MKRINCIRLVVLTILVLAVGQIGAMDQTLNKELVELQRRIDTGDLEQVRQQIEGQNLKGHLNDVYYCEYISIENGGFNWDMFKYHPRFEFEVQSQLRTKTGVVNTRELSSLSYALNKYQKAIKSEYSNPNDIKGYLAIVHYFLQECQATFNRLPEELRDQRFLVIATTCGDMEAVKLFINHGMLQLPRWSYNGQFIDLLAMVQAGRDHDGNQVSQEIKEAYAQMLPYFDGRRFSFTAKNTAIAFVAAAIVALGVKKAYDWFSNSSDEQDEAEQSADAASSAPDQVDPVCA